MTQVLDSTCDGVSERHNRLHSPNGRTSPPLFVAASRAVAAGDGKPSVGPRLTAGALAIVKRTNKVPMKLERTLPELGFGYTRVFRGPKAIAVTDTATGTANFQVHATSTLRLVHHLFSMMYSGSACVQNFASPRLPFCAIFLPDENAFKRRKAVRHECWLAQPALLPASSKNPQSSGISSSQSVAGKFER